MKNLIDLVWKHKYKVWIFTTLFNAYVYFILPPISEELFYLLPIYLFSILCNVVSLFLTLFIAFELTSKFAKYLDGKRKRVS